MSETWGPCIYCESEQLGLPMVDEVHAHLVALKLHDGRVHIHAPLDKKELMIELVRTIIKEAKLNVQDIQPVKEGS